MLISFQQWCEFNYGSTSYDQALKRPQYMQPIFKVTGTKLSGAGEEQKDPMKHTLHGKKDRVIDKSTSARLYGFANKKSKAPYTE